jgi:hypothetical protein
MEADSRLEQESDGRVGRPRLVQPLPPEELSEAG